MDPELALIALVGLAGIVGTLLGVEWSARNGQEMMRAQWSRDDETARLRQGKDAARAILDELIRAAELFGEEPHQRRVREMLDISETKPPVPEWVVTPERSKLEPHYRAIRRRAVEIAEPVVAVWLRHFARVLWSPDDVLKFADIPTGRMVAERLVSAAEQVIGAYLRDERIPEIGDIPEFDEMVDALRAYEEMMAEQYRHWLAELDAGPPREASSEDQQAPAQE